MINMSDIGILFRVYPDDNIDINKLSEAIKKSTNAVNLEIEEIGFGIKVLKVFFKYNDSETTSSEIEDKLKNTKGVSQVEVIEESLI